jgi:hypothetical protein
MVQDYRLIHRDKLYIKVREKNDGESNMKYLRAHF